MTNDQTDLLAELMKEYEAIDEEASDIAAGFSEKKREIRQKVKAGGFNVKAFTAAFGDRKRERKRADDGLTEDVARYRHLLD